MLTEPAETWLRPVPEPPPLTVMTAPEFGQSLTYCFAAASTSGWSAVEPEAVIEPPTQRLRADFSYTVKGNRMEFVRVRRNADGGLDCYRSQDSSMISSAVWCDGLAMIAAGSTVSPGDMIDYVPGPRT